MLFGSNQFDNYMEDNRREGTEVPAILRDQPETSSDMKVLTGLPMSALDSSTVLDYRNRHQNYRGSRVWMNLAVNDYLERIGAARISREDGELHPTVAGLLMFGPEYKILYEFPEYFLDFTEVYDPSLHWTNRLQSSSGDWTGNLYEFFFRVYRKLALDIDTPFHLEEETRMDQTPVHHAVREALVNCLVNADFYIPRGVVIRKTPGCIVFENPGSIRPGKAQMLRGGISDPRNKGLLRMFNLIGIGERAESGTPDIFSVWEQQGWVAPEVEEQFGPDRTVLRLRFQKQQVPKAKHYSSKDAMSAKIRQYLQQSGESSNKEIASFLNLSMQRTRVILRAMPDVEVLGANRNRTYRLAEDKKYETFAVQSTPSAS